jgi:hypothetical protein
MQNKFSKKLAMIIITILTISVISAAIPFASATITDRPTVYRGDGTTDAPVTIEAGTTASIDTEGMTITGAQIWLWLSTTGGSEINVALGDRPYAGPFLLSELIAAGPYSYTFTPANIASLCAPLSADSPFAGEQRSYTYTIGDNWINGTIPLKVQGEDVDYWIKIADVSPADVIAGSEIGVSTNRVHFLPGFDATPLMSAPETTVTVSGYALPATSEYNVTEDGDTVLGLQLPGTYDEGGWVWTGFSSAFNIEDLENKVQFGTTPPPSVFTPVNITVWENDTATDLATWDFDQYWREVYLEDENSAGALAFRGDTGDYSGLVTLETGSTYDVEIEFFPAFGTASVYLGNVLVTSGVALNGTGGVLTTVTIPSLTTDDYTFCVKDNNSVMYNFTVHVEMVPYIYCTPDMGYVGDSFSVTGVNFLDYVGDYITVYFEDTNPSDYVLLWNQTIASSTWTTGALTVPSSWGGTRRVEARDITGFTTYANTTFTVLTMINVIPDEINNTVCQTVEVEGTGFFYGTDDVEGWLVFIDNAQYFGYWDFFHYGISDTGDVMFEFAAAGFRPGLHVVSVIPQTFGELPWIITAKDNFWVTYEGDLIKMNLDAYLEDINATVVAIWDGMATLETAMGEVTVAVTDLGASITTIEGNVATIRTDVGTIKTSLTSLSASISSVSSGMATLQTSIGTVQTSLASIDAVIGSMYGDLLTIDTTIGSFETSLDSIDATVSGLDSDVTALIGDVASIDTVLGSVAGTVTAMEGTLATIETDLGTVQVDLASAKTDIAAVETDVNDNLPVDMMPVWIAVVLALIAAIGSIAGVFIIQRKIA